MGLVLWLTLLACLSAVVFIWIIDEEDIRKGNMITRQQEPGEQRPMEANLTAFVLGHTGRVGQYVTRSLLASPHYTRVVLMGRREIKYDDPLFDKAEQIVVDFDKIEDYKEAFAGLDVGFCCLGVRLPAAKEMLQKVDHDYVVNSAHVAREAGVKQFHLVSARGTDKDGYFNYASVKGKAEENIKTLDFERYCIYKIGHVLWKLEEMTKKEKAAYYIARAFAVGRQKIYTIPADTLANGMILNALEKDKNGIQVYENKDIYPLVDSTYNTNT